jgi:hypothetical protein
LHFEVENPRELTCGPLPLGDIRAPLLPVLRMVPILLQAPFFGAEIFMIINSDHDRDYLNLRATEQELGCRERRRICAGNGGLAGAIADLTRSDVVVTTSSTLHIYRTN